MYQAEHQPLRITLGFAPQSETIQPFCGIDIAKHRFNTPYSLTVDMSASVTVDFCFHFINQASAHP
jgi:hypothetical protein